MGLWQDFQEEPISKLSLREPVIAASQDTVRTAIGRMRDQQLGCTIVADRWNKPVGIFTESAVTALLNREGPQILDDPLKTHMTTPCPWVQLTDPISYMLEAMQLKNLRFLCVVDDTGKIVGLTGQKGLIEFVADHFPGQVMVQRVGGHAYPTHREGA